MTRDGLANKALAERVPSPTRRKSVRACRKNHREWNPGHRGSRAQTQRSAVYCVTDMQSLRYSHPEAQRIGQHLKVMTSLKR